MRETIGKGLYWLGLVWIGLVITVIVAGYIMAIYLGGWNQILNYEGESLLFYVVWFLPGFCADLARAQSLPTSTD